MMRALVLVLACLAAPLRAQDEPAFTTTTVSVGPSDPDRFALVDADGDGRLDLLRIAPRGLELRRLGDDGRYAEEPAWSLSWPATKVAWDLADADGDGAVDVVMLVEGRRVVAYRPASGATEPTLLLDDVAAYLPAGLRLMRFVHDVDGDGRADLVLPGSGRYLIHLAGPDGFAAAPLEVVYDADIELQVGDPEGLDGRFAQQIAIPLFRLTDVDGDGRTDLLAEGDDELAVYLAGPGLPREPSWRLDLAALRAEVDQPERIDLQDLFRNIPARVTWRFDDLDGQPPHDLVLQRGGRFTVHLDGSRGADPSAPDQVLKASGTVLHFVLRDVDGDGLKDLQLVRAGTISLGTVLRWLVISGSLDFDVFTYRNEGGRFSRRPESRKAIELKVPALLGFVERIEETEDEVGRRFSWPARPLCLDADGRRDDVVDVRGSTLVFVRDRVPEGFREGLEEQVRAQGVDGLLESWVFGALDDVEDGGKRVVDLEEFDRLLPAPGWDLHQAVDDLPPAATVALPDEFDRIERIRVADLDGDGRSDVIGVGHLRNGGEFLTLVVRRAEDAR